MGERITYRANGGEAHGYLALPEVGEQGPAVVVIQEWWGLVSHIEDVVERFAAEGFVALAPDLYHGVVTDEPDEARKQLMALRYPQAAADIAGAAAYLESLPESAGKGVGVIGFCMGGSLALWSATVADPITAVVAFYPAMGWDQLRPDWTRYRGKAALVHAAEGDGGTGADHLRQARREILDAGGSVDLLDYPGTHHAFFNDTRPESYHEDAARQAWARTLDFLRGQLD